MSRFCWRRCVCGRFGWVYVRFRPPKAKRHLISIFFMKVSSNSDDAIRLTLFREFKGIPSKAVNRGLACVPKEDKLVHAPLPLGPNRCLVPEARSHPTMCRRAYLQHDQVSYICALMCPPGDVITHRKLTIIGTNVFGCALTFFESPRF